MPDAARDALDRGLAPYRARYADARWLDPGSWHVTLLFLGSVAAERVGSVIELVDDASSGQAPFGVAIDGGGGYTSRRGSVAWLTVGQGAAEVIALADVVHARCPADVTLGRAPRRTQSAHLTVARRISEEVIRGLATSDLGPLEARWTVDRLTLYRSHLSPHGSEYEALHEAVMSAS